mmetsp:Transcript_7662/g.15144  ORF Transcript_7662/g.15144 Transcript_7662/m.15144 type:complete len:239 (+) Transcript_7662:131-847(+)
MMSRRSLLSIITFCFIYCLSTVDAVSATGSSLPPPSSTSDARIYRSSIDRYVDKWFQGTDTNNDGEVSFEEAYVGCLFLYIQLNRSAPIPPPNRETFRRIFSQAAGNKKRDALNMDEYEKMLKKIVGRAVLRLSSHKIVTLVGAPVLAEMILRSIISRKEGYETLLRFIIPSRFQDATISTLTSTGFIRGFWMVILVTTLGDICLNAVTFLLDLSLPKFVDPHQPIECVQQKDKRSRF